MNSQPSLSGETVTEPKIYRIRDGVTKVFREKTIVLVSPLDGTSMRVSKASKDILPLLGKGASFEDMWRRLAELYPGAKDVDQKLHAFLNQLTRVGLLDNSQRQKVLRSPRLELFEMDPLSKYLSNAIRCVPKAMSWTFLVLLLVYSMAATTYLIFSGSLPDPTDLVSQFSIWGVGIFILIVIPLHELAHGVACRLVGARVGKAGIIVHGGFVPGVYVDTSGAYTIPNKVLRFWIPAAGPIVNLTSVGVAASFLCVLGDESSLTATFSTLFLLSVLFVYFDTNPLTPSDGSHMVEALLDDELARVSSLSFKRSSMSDRKTVAIYRAMASFHLQTAAILFYFWIT